MLLNLVNEDGDVFQLTVAGGPSETIDNCKALFEAQYGVPMAQQRWMRDGTELPGPNTLEQLRVAESDLVVVMRRPSHPPVSTRAPAMNPAMPVPVGASPVQQQSPQQPINSTALTQMLQNIMGQQASRPTTPAQIPPGLRLDQISLANYEPKVLFEYFKGRDDIMAQLASANSALADSILTNNQERFATMIKAIVENEKARKDAERERQAELNMLQIRLANDPFDVEAQARIEEIIRAEQVNENMEQAMEYSPESFGSVIMLYVDAVVNNVPVKAFVDTGAQSTIMSAKCAERCGIMRLLDKRFAGIAKGVGTSKILGRVHLAPLKLAGEFFQCSFSILENQDIEFIFGLDMLKRHQCIVDLAKNELVVGSEGKVRLPFLSEADIPRAERDGGEPTNSQMQESSSNNAGSAMQEKVQRLMEVGMSQKQAEEALKATNGDENMAVSLYFNS